MTSSNTMPRIVCVVGPTSSGKTTLGIRLAKKFQGEIINADSRQIYKGFDIGTGKPIGERGVYEGHRTYFVKEVPHYLMDFLDPTTPFSVVDWREKAVKAIHGIMQRGHVPLVVGGTGLYLGALIDNFDFPHVQPSPTMRQAFEQKSLEDLVKLLLQLDPAAEQLVDLKNRRRVMRAVEVTTFTGKPFTEQKLVARPEFDVFQVGIHWSREDLNARIDQQIDEMMARGWFEEVKRLLEKRTPLTAPAMSSIGYRELVRVAGNETSLSEAVKHIKIAVHQYAKRQQTWFKRDARIHWAKDETEAMKVVSAWLRQ